LNGISGPKESIERHIGPKEGIERHIGPKESNERHIHGAQLYLNTQDIWPKQAVLPRGGLPVESPSYRVIGVAV
jgi:hypothetical protein